MFLNVNSKALDLANPRVSLSRRLASFTVQYCRYIVSSPVTSLRESRSKLLIYRVIFADILRENLHSRTSATTREARCCTTLYSVTVRMLWMPFISQLAALLLKYVKKKLPVYNCV